MKIRRACTKGPGRRGGFAALAVTGAVLLAFGQPVASRAGSHAAGTTTTSAGPFDKVWTYAFSQYAQASQSGDSVTQLTDGTIVAGGDDAYQPN